MVQSRPVSFASNWEFEHGLTLILSHYATCSNPECLQHSFHNCKLQRMFDNGGQAVSLGSFPTLTHFPLDKISSFKYTALPPPTPIMLATFPTEWQDRQMRLAYERRCSHERQAGKPVCVNSLCSSLLFKHAVFS